MQLTRPGHIAIVACAAAILLAAGCAGSDDHPNASSMHHHYFLIGKRTCADALRHSGLPPLHIKGVTVIWSSPTVVSVNPSQFPKPYRHDVVAGCDAAG